MGYALEVFFTDQEMEAAIEDCFQAMVGGEAFRGLKTLFRDLTVVMTNAWERSQEKIEKARSKQQKN